MTAVPRELFVDRFRQVAGCYAQQPAVIVDGITQATYQQLLDQAEHFATTLSCHVGRDDLVSLRLDKGSMYVAAMTGVWLAGAAWVPIPDSWPDDRIQRMLNDCRPRCSVECRDGEICIIPSAGMDDHPRPSERQPDDLAYVIYTSGTSGRPRGVAIEQRGIVPLLDAQREFFGISSDSRCLWFYPTAFDASVSDIGTALLSGAALIVDSRLNRTPDAGLVSDILNDHRVTHADLPPSLLPFLSPSQLPESLSTVVVGGEACDAATVHRWIRHKRVVNVYGPTEATVCTSLCDYSSAYNGRALVGDPLPGVTYSVVDAYDREVLPGETGELLIAGTCLARGYVNMPEATAERFISMRGQRYYRSGDRVRRDFDGELVFLGRLDRQINHHGLRIEPAEIECVINNIDNVTRSAVMLQQTSVVSQHQILAAWVECAEHAPDVAAVRHVLTQHLPADSVPSRIIIVDRFPRLASGKTDYQALLTSHLPAGTDCETEAALSGPEGKLLRICRTVLGYPSFAANENFFEAGGDSLGAIDVSASALAEGLSVPASLVTEGKTVREICRRMLNGHSSAETSLSCDWLKADVSDRAQRLRQSWQHCSPRTDSSAEETWLLTGATGYLGCRILEHILGRTTASVTCLVRANDRQHAKRRLQEHLNVQQIAISPEQWHRVNVLCGDLSAPQSGLSGQDREQIVQSVTQIIHSAAEVHSLTEYSQLRDVNVLAVADLLEIAAESQHGAIFHHVSTLSVFAATDRYQGTHPETDDAMSSQTVFGGYAQTKWAAEYLVHTCGAPAGRTIVVRPGLLTADTRTGIAPAHDVLTLLVQGLDGIACVPEPVPDICFDMTPVNKAAEAVVAIAVQKRHSGGFCWHLANPQPVSASDLFACLRERNPRIETVTWEEFRRRATDNRQQASGSTLRSSAACLGLARWLSGDSPDRIFRDLDLFQTTGATFDTTRTREYLQHHGIVIPPGDRKLLAMSLQRILSCDSNALKTTARP